MSDQSSAQSSSQDFVCTGDVCVRVQPERVMTTDNFLTSPIDRVLTPQQLKEQIIMIGGLPPLTNEQTTQAMKDLCVGDPVPNYPGVDRLYADPVIPDQRVALFSFIPAKGATPDRDGFYGMAKIRGCFENPNEAVQREELLVRSVDSYHKIQMPKVGRPFPITTESKYAAEQKEIDIRKKTVEIVSQDIRKQKMDDQKEIREIEDRAQKLREDTNKDVDDVDPMELYTTLVVKKAQLSFTFLEHEKKMEEIKKIIITTRSQLKDLDEKSPDYRKAVHDKYMKARAESGLSNDDQSFLRYIHEDAPLPF